jgi:hypothetical protein
MWMFFLSSFINFCFGKQPAMIIFVFFNFLTFVRFHGNGSHFEKNQPLTAQLHMAYDIPTRFHRV